METKNVKINHASIINFKGIKSLDIDFSDETTISGMNATGKSTIFDAILWCFFGKNSQDAKDFSIKNTVDKSLNRADHIVELRMSVNGSSVTPKRVYKEKWTKRRGSEETEFTGHETLFFWNDVPVNAGEYAAKVGELIPEQLFKQITNPLYFNMTMGWKDRRDTLIHMAGDVSDERVINGHEAFKALFAKIEGQKSLVEYAKEISFEKIGYKKQLADIPARIDELIKSNPKVQDWKSIETEILSKQEAIKKINKEVEDINTSFNIKMDVIKTQQKLAIDANRKMGEIENDLTKKAYAEASEANKAVNEAKYQLGVVRTELRTILMQERGFITKIEQLKPEIQKLRDKFNIENAKEFVFDESLSHCPTCLVPFKTDDVEAKKAELFGHFRESMDKTISQIRTEGKAKSAELTETEKSLQACLIEKLALQEKEQTFVWSETSVPAQPKPVAPLLEKNIQYQALKAVTEQVINVDQPDITEQKGMIACLQEGIDELKTLLGGRVQIEKNEIRIKELKAEEKRYAQMLADLEKQEFTIAEFNKQKMNLIESSINNRFKIVKFKLFETQINGGEVPCCETCVDGVPFSDLNHAMQINAGIDCINALSEHYGVSAPLVVDNSEAVNELLPTNSQLIKLAVTKDKELVITNN